MVHEPKATKIPLRLPLSRHDLATVIFTNPGGITPPSAAKKVNKKSFDSSKVELFYAKLNIRNSFIFFKVLFFVKSLNTNHFFG